MNVLFSSINSIYRTVQQSPTDLKICRGYLFIYSGAIINQLTIISPLIVHALAPVLFI